MCRHPRRPALRAFGLAACLSAQVASSGCSRSALAPEGPFLWGVSVAGHQVEGGDRASQWARWGALGKTKHRNARATDSFRRFKEDLDLAAGMGLSAYRFSIEWSRVEPAPGKIDPVAVDHYRRVAREARARGMTPIVTLFHFAYPAWLDDPDARGDRGWERRDASDLFARYVSRVVGAFRAEKPLWITVNEPTIFASFGYYLGLWPPGKRDRGATVRVVDHLLDGHGKAYAEIHRQLPDAQVSFNNFAAPIHLSRLSEPFAAAAPPVFGFFEGLWGHPDLWFLRALRPSLTREVDFAALDYYFPVALEVPRPEPPWEWRVYPRGLYEAIRDYANFFGKPVLVAENGMATQDGAPRVDGWTREAFLVAHVQELERAKAAGVPVLGYCHWSLLDNYEWGSFEPRFGLYQVNYGDEGLTRIPTPAVAYYRDIAQNGSVRPEIAALVREARAEALRLASEAR